MKLPATAFYNMVVDRYHSVLARIRPTHSSQKQPAGMLNDSSCSKAKPKSVSFCEKRKKTKATEKAEPSKQLRLEGTAEEAEFRRQAHFGEVEERLPVTPQVSEMPRVTLKDKVFAHLGRKNPLAKAVVPGKDKVTVFDNLAYRPGESQAWRADYTAYFHIVGKHDVANAVGAVADIIGIDGKPGVNEGVKSIIADRIQPFVYDVAPARSAKISVPQLNGPSLTKTLGPSNAGGISSQVELLPGGDEYDGTTTTNTVLGFQETFETFFSGPEGWGVISDIDDTIKVTQTTSPVGILKTTFVDESQPISGMCELYSTIHEQFKAPAWFYLSASPYQLYPALHKFVHNHYQPGPLLLRDDSWMYVGGLLQSLTTGTAGYKKARIEKIHSCLPHRKFICVGDSTQADPEVYGHAYRQHPDWIRAIYIRKVRDFDNMETKNRQERFDAAFEGVPTHVWRVFEQPEDLADHLAHVAGDAHIGLVGKLQAYFCKDEKAMKAPAKVTVEE